MIIKPKPVSLFWLKLAGYCVTIALKVTKNKLIIRPVDIRPNHSYLLLCNHFSFADGFISFYLAYQTLIKQGKMKRLYIMVLKKQIEKNPWLRYFGAFSVEPGKILSIKESLAYAAEVLNTPGNVLLFFPQGNLESCHVQTIQFQDGLATLVPQIEGDCQLLWSSNIIEYFESIKASVYFDMLDCGTNKSFDFDSLQQQVNAHHKAALKSNIRFTKEDQPAQETLKTNS